MERLKRPKKGNLRQTKRIREHTYWSGEKRKYDVDGVLPDWNKFSHHQCFDAELFDENADSSLLKFCVRKSTLIPRGRKCHRLLTWICSGFREEVTACQIMRLFRLRYLICLHSLGNFKFRGITIHLRDKALDVNNWRSRMVSGVSQEYWYSGVYP